MSKFYNDVNIETETLQNGLRVAVDSFSTIESVVVAVMVKAGSRNEVSSNNGVAHFLEHMAFKGTTKRTAKDISDAVENVGGYVNAYTSKDRTMYYIKVLKEDVELAVDILSDIIQDSIISNEELEKERNVILQELALSLDTPSDIVFDYFSSDSFGEGTPIGRSILGPKENISQMSRDTLNSFMKENYSAKNMIVGASGNIDSKKFFNLVEKYFNKLDSSNKIIKDAKSDYIGSNVNLYEKKDLEQMQFLMGFNGFGQNDIKQMYQSNVMVNVLGGGMSSRLFQEIREKRGLAYSVSSYSDSYLDSGCVVFYADSNVEKVENLIDAFSSVIKSSIENIEEEELERTKKQYQASILMAQESVSSRVNKLLNSFLSYDRYIQPKEVISYLNEIKTSDLSDMLNDIVVKSESPFTMTLYGDFSKISPDVIQKIKNIKKGDIF